MIATMTETTIYEFWMLIPGEVEHYRLIVPASSQIEAEGMYTKFLKYLLASAGEAYAKASLQLVPEQKKKKKEELMTVFGKPGVLTEAKLLQQIKNEPRASIITTKLGRSGSNIYYHLNKLKEKGYVQLKNNKWTLTNAGKKALSGMKRIPNHKPTIQSMVNPEKDNEYMKKHLEELKEGEA